MASRVWISWSATLPVSSSGRRPFKRCSRKDSMSSATSGPSSSRYGSTTLRAGITIWRSVPVVSTLLDPSDYFNAWYRTGGPQNYSMWHNEKFDALVDQIDREVDPAKRHELVRQTEEIMEQDPPVFPVAWEKINDVWYDYVKGLDPYDFFGVYDVVRQDTVWLDKA